MIAIAFTLFFLAMATNGASGVLTLGFLAGGIACILREAKF